MNNDHFWRVCREIADMRHDEVYDLPAQALNDMNVPHDDPFGIPTVEDKLRLIKQYACIYAHGDMFDCRVSHDPHKYTFERKRPS
jgi:hypothetical protein